MCKAEPVRGNISLKYAVVQSVQSLVAAAPTPALFVAVCVYLVIDIAIGGGLLAPASGDTPTELLELVAALWRLLPSRPVVFEALALTAVAVATARSGYKLVPEARYQLAVAASEEFASTKVLQPLVVNPALIRARQAIDMAVKANDLKAAEKLLEEMARGERRPDVVAHNLVMRGHILKGDLRSAERMFGRMQERGLKPTLCSYNMLLDAFSKANQLDRCEELLQKMQKDRVQADAISFGTIITARARRGDKALAEATLERMFDVGVQPDAVCYNALVHACAVHGDAQGAEHWTDEMRRQGLALTVTTFTAVIDACAKAGEVNRAENWLERMERAGIQPNIVSYGALLDACARNCDPERAELWYERMVAFGIEPNSHTFSAIVTACSRARDPMLAERWLARAENAGVIDTVIYSGVIDAYSKLGDGAGAEGVLRRMKAKGVRPHIVAYASAIRAHSQTGNWPKIEEIVAEMDAAGVRWNEYVLFSLLMAYSSARPKQPERAEATFRKALAEGVPANVHVCGALARNIGRSRTNEIMREFSLHVPRYRGSGARHASASPA